MGRQYGHFVSEATKVKLSQAGLGRVLSRETREKISRAKLGRHLTTETCARMSQSKTGHIVTPETRSKISRAKTGIPVSAKVKARLLWYNTARHEGRLICTPETGAKISAANRGRKDSEETRIKKSRVRIGMKFSKEHCANVGKSKKLAWQNPEWRDKVVQAQQVGRHTHPNRPEATVTLLLEHLYPNEWKFVGDGSFVIGGKNPDFANINGQKKLIELFGNYWHRGEDPQNRIDIFALYGFTTLVIWERELEDVDKVTERIREFAAKSAPNIKTRLKISE